MAQHVCSKELCKQCGNEYQFTYCSDCSEDYERNGFCSYKCKEDLKLVKIRKFSSKYMIPVQVIREFIDSYTEYD